jgi:hypothetical protein
VFELKQGGVEFSPRRHRGVSEPHLRGATRGRGPHATAHQIPRCCEVVVGASAAAPSSPIGSSGDGTDCVPV